VESTVQGGGDLEDSIPYVRGTGRYHAVPLRLLACRRQNTLSHGPWSNQKFSVHTVQQHGSVFIFLKKYIMFSSSSDLYMFYLVTDRCVQRILAPTVIKRQCWEIAR